MSPAVKLKSISASESGAIALLPMIMVLAFSAMCVLGYLSISQNVLARMNSKREGEQSIDNVLNRVSSLLGQKNFSGCDSGITAAILNIRNLSKDTPVSFAKNFKAVTVPALTEISCVLTADEGSKLVSLKISFFSINTDQDISQLSRTVKIAIQGQSTRFANNISVERLVRIRVANLAQNALVLWGTNTKNKIDIGSASLSVYGTTLVAVDNPNTPFTLSGFVSGLGIPYNGQVVFKKGVYTNSIYASTGADAMLQKQLVSVFTSGLQTNYLPGVALPIFSNSDPVYSGVDKVWQNNIDYEYVYTNAMAPLPEYPGYTPMIDSSHVYSGANAVKKIPESGNTLNVSDTCRGLDDDQGSIRAMVFLQQQNTVTIDFNKSSEPITGTDAFCGLVMAKTLTVKLRGDANLFGHFFVGKLRVEGTGNLQIVDPESPSDIVLPAVGHGFDLLRRQLLGLQIFIGQPFYVPLAYNPTPTFASYTRFIPQPVYNSMVIDSPGANPTWPTSIQSLNRSADPTKTPAYQFFKSGAGTVNAVFTTEVIL